MGAAPGGQYHPSPWDAGGVLVALLPLLGRDPLALCVNRSVDAGRTRRDPGACTRVCTHRDAAPHRHRQTAAPAPAVPLVPAGGRPRPVQGYVTVGGAALAGGALGARCLLSWGCFGDPGSLFCAPGLFCNSGVVVFSALDPRFTLHPLVVVLHPGRVLYPEFVLHHKVIVLHSRFLVLYPGSALHPGAILLWTPSSFCTSTLFCIQGPFCTPRVLVCTPGSFCIPQLLFCNLGACSVPWAGFAPRVCSARRFSFPLLELFFTPRLFLRSRFCYHSCFCLFCTLVSVMHPGFFGSPGFQPVEKQVSVFHSRFYFSARVLF